MESAALLGAGLLAGFVDSIAGGGGLITLPALLWAGMPPSLALGTNKLQASFGATVACFRYMRGGLIQRPGLILGLALSFAFAALGGYWVTRVDARRLGPFIPLVLLAVGIYTWLKPELGRETRPPRMPMAAFAGLFGVALGFYDGSFGPGTGSFWMTACVLCRGMDFAAAAGFTKVMNLASNLGALAIFAWAGEVDYANGLLMAAGQLVGASLGSGVVLRRGAAFVRPMFLTIVFALVLRLILSHWIRR
ncbi:MAG: TSUP family transporter [Verrucomicrobia bacterium]|nr:TSUP family transporter [Verrucomicrobiota bacterium]MBI3868289.1 TSUP family transporter [Verrucomicrobiota bacterium]